MSRYERWLLWLNGLGLLAFMGLIFWAQNVEFLLYGVVLLLLGYLVFAVHRRVSLSLGVLLGLSAWAWLHLAGGNVPVGESVLYNWLIWELVGEPFQILKYDQVVHAFGFGVTTAFFYEVIHPRWSGPSRVGPVMMAFFAALGAGATNEIVEFIATITVPNTNVGGYYNTALDLVFNALGAGGVALYFLGRRR